MVSFERDTGKTADGRDRLIAAGIELFGKKGFEATTTREIAQAAGTNIAGIAYHFGGKEGLYLACARHIATVVAGRFGTVASDQSASPPGDARDAMAAILSAMTTLLVATPSMEPYTRFVLREHMDPTSALDILIGSLMGPTSDRLCALWAEATGADPQSEETHLTILNLVGGVLVFRVARIAICRRMGWHDIAEAEATAIEARAHATLDALLAAHGGTKP